MSDNDRDREALEFFFGNGSNMPPDTSISDLAKQLGTPGAVVYEGEVAAPPPNPHREADELAAEAAKKARAELATAQRAAAAGAAAEAVRNGATPEQAQTAAREAVAALQREADAKAAQYASTHPPTPPAPASAQPAGTPDGDEVAAFEATMGIGPAAGAAGSIPDVPTGWEPQVTPPGAPDLSAVPAMAQPLAADMLAHGLDPAAHGDLLAEAADLMAAATLGLLGPDATARAEAVNQAAKALGLGPIFN